MWCRSTKRLLLCFASALLLACTLPGQAVQNSVPSPVTIYQSLAPGIVFVSTPTGTGSGIWLSDGYLVTNYHVIWPYDAARVVFPDGSEWLDVPLAASDQLTDLALLGPIQATAQPLTLSAPGDLPPGATVYLIGYPAEVEAYPQPAITGGLVSRLRRCAAMDLHFIQTDAMLSGGQSGGALVSEDGRIIGISGLTYGGAFGLVASATDIIPRLAALTRAAQEPADRPASGDGPPVWLAARPYRGTEPQVDHVVTLETYWHAMTFAFEAAPGTEVAVTVSGREVWFSVLDPYGVEVLSDGGSESGASNVMPDRDRAREGTVTVAVDGPHLLVVGHGVEGEGSIRVSASVPLEALHDPDDGQTLTIGEAIYANLDHPLDTDYYLLDMVEGQQVEVTVDSIMIDPVVIVDYVGASSQDMASDDDSGGGLYGLNAALTYRAPHTGSYFVVVEDSQRFELGGYVLAVQERP